MALPWLKPLLGEHYSEEIEKQVEAKIGEGFVARNDFNNRGEELKSAKEQLAQRDADIATLKKGAGENDDLKKQITELQAKHKAETEAAAGELAKSRMTAAVDLALVTAGARSVKATKALLEMEKVKMDGEALLGLSEQIETLKKEQSYLFATSGDTSTQTATSTAPPGYTYQPKGGETATSSPKDLHEAVANEMAARMAKAPPQT